MLVSINPEVPLALVLLNEDSESDWNWSLHNVLYRRFTPEVLNFPPLSLSLSFFFLLPLDIFLSWRIAPLSEYVHYLALPFSLCECKALPTWRWEEARWWPCQSGRYHACADSQLVCHTEIVYPLHTDSDGEFRVILMSRRLGLNEQWSSALRILQSKPRKKGNNIFYCVGICVRACVCDYCTTLLVFPAKLTGMVGNWESCKWGGTKRSCLIRALFQHFPGESVGVPAKIRTEHRSNKRVEINH
jgi:hypothetical protein